MIAAGIGALALASYVAWLLFSIRRNAFGEGSLLELPQWGLSLRYPHWWKLDVCGPEARGGGETTGGAGAGRQIDPAAKGHGSQVPSPEARAEGEDRSSAGLSGGAAQKAPSVRFWTGHHRGLLTIESVHHHASPTDGDLRGFLGELLARRAVLDSTEISMRGIGHPSGSTDPRDASRTACRATVASGGRQSPSSEERSYFEYHLVRIDGMLILFSYTNSVLQGFLDAFYIEKMMGTIERLEHPPATAPG